MYYGTVERKLHFIVEEDGLTVPFGVGKIQFAPEDIAAVDYVADPPRMRRAMGAGTRGLQMGWYVMGGFGRVYRLTTGRQHVVTVDTSADTTKARPDTRYVFNPEDPERFVELLNAVRVGETIGDETVFAPQAGPGSGLSLQIFLIVLVVIPVGIVMPWLLVKGRRDLRYEVGAGGVTVHHLGKKVYPWDTVKNIRILDERPSLTRLFGTSMSGYYAGKFSGRPLGNVQVNATRLEPPVVIIETAKDKLLLSPDDVDGFIEAVGKFRPAS